MTIKFMYIGHVIMSLDICYLCVIFRNKTIFAFFTNINHLMLSRNRVLFITFVL